MTCGQALVNCRGRKDMWPHVKVMIFFFLRAHKWLRALTDTGVKASLIWKSTDFKEQKMIGTGLGGKQIETIRTKIWFKNRAITSKNLFSNDHSYFRIYNYDWQLGWQDSTHGHHQMVITEIRLIIFFAAKNGEAL